VSSFTRHSLTFLYSVLLVDSTPSIDRLEEDHQEDGSRDTDDISMERAPALPPISLRSLNVISSHIPHVQAAQEQLVGEMEAMLVTGVQELVGNFRYDSGLYILTIALEQATPIICAINCAQPSYSPGDGTKSCW